MSRGATSRCHPCYWVRSISRRWKYAQVYNSLGNGGFHAPLKAVRAVLDVDGKPLERYQLKIDRATILGRGTT